MSHARVERFLVPLKDLDLVALSQKDKPSMNINPVYNDFKLTIKKGFLIKLLCDKAY